MKKIFKTGGGGILFAALIFALVGCPIGDDNGYVTAKDVDWKNYTTSSDRAFMVRNNTSKNLVAFKGNLMQSNILGGIPNNSNGHGIKKNTTLLSQTGDFPMILITEEDYISNKSNLAALDQTPFTRIYVYYNTQGDNDIVYDISSRLGGNKIIEIGNNSNSLNVEIRLGGINGETIGYAPAGKNITKLYVNDGDFDLFPVFKRYNNVRDVVETIYPKATTGRAWFKPLAFDESTNTVYFNVSEAMEGLSTLTSGVAWLSIQNSTAGAIHLVKGNTIVREAGVSYFNSSQSKTFPIEMPGVPGSTSTFASSVTLSEYKVGPNANEVPIKTTDGNTTFTLEADKLYVVTVTGDVNRGDLAAVIDLGQTTEAPLDDLPDVTL